jgi:dihydroorotase
MTIEGKIVNIDGVRQGRVEIDESSGLITSVSQPTGKADLVFKEELIFPGFVDLHVHAREDVSHNQDYKEDFVSASAAAINGGVVAIAEMPNNPVPSIDEKSYADKKALTAKSKIEIVLYAGIGQGSKPLFGSAPAESPFGIHRPTNQPINGHATTQTLVPYKAFMSPSVGDLFFKSQAELDETLERYQGQSVSFHCEDPEILEKFKNQATHEARRPKEAEISAVGFVLKLIEKHQLQGKICHISAKESLNLIVEAKKQGVNVTCEVTPHHLYFDDTAIASVAKQSFSGDKIASSSLRSRFGGLGSDALLAMTKLLQVNPPIRSREDREALLLGLKNGQIDFLATDHAPHTKEEKLTGVSGIPHLDTYGLFVSWLMREHQFAPEDITRVCSFNPGKFLNQFTPTPEPRGRKSVDEWLETQRILPRSHGDKSVVWGFIKNQYGKIEAGYTGSLTVIDVRQTTLVKAENLKTKCAWSPFEGMEFPGKVIATIIKGKTYKHGA